MASRNLKSNHFTKLIIFIIYIQLTISQNNVTENIWKTNCFGDSQNSQCKDSLIKICSDYYMCDMVIETNLPPKRIGYVNGKVLVAIESQSYFVSNSTLSPMSTRRIIPPWDEFVDKLENRYYAADGTTYVLKRDSNKEIEIVTTGEHSFNQLAFDFENSKLFILAFHSNNERSGSLFALKTESLNIVDDKVQAERIQEAGNQITAMAVEGGLDKLLLGIRTTGGGKLIRITKQEENPCTESIFGKKAIENIIRETQEKLLQIFTGNISQLLRSRELGTGDTNIRVLEMDNVRLKRDLRVATAKLNSFTSKLLSFNRNLRSTPKKLTDDTLYDQKVSIESDNVAFPTNPPSPRAPPGPPGPNWYLNPPGYPRNPTHNYPTGPPGLQTNYTLKNNECDVDKCVSLEAHNEVQQKLVDALLKISDLERKLTELFSGVDSILADVD